MQLSHRNLLNMWNQWGQICRNHQEGSETFIKYVKIKVGLSKGIGSESSRMWNPLSGNDVMSEIVNVFVSIFTKEE